MIKYFCDKCGKELVASEVQLCTEIIGTKHFCTVHAREYNKKLGNKNWGSLTLGGYDIPYESSDLETDVVTIRSIYGDVIGRVHVR